MWAVRGGLDSGRVITETWRVYNLQRGCTSVVVVRRMMGGGQLWDEETDRSYVRG